MLRMQSLTELLHRQARFAFCQFSLIALIAFPVTTAAGELYLLDTFNRADGNRFDPLKLGNSPNPIAGQSGILSPVRYASDAKVQNNQVTFIDNAGLYDAIKVEYDLNSASGIDAEGGFRISFDANPILNGFGLSDGWIGLSIGHQSIIQQHIGAGYYGVGDPTTALFGIFRDNGGGFRNCREFDV